MAQSYVGKRPISKGIGRVIRRFVIVAFALHASGRRPQVSAQRDARLRAGAATRHGLRDFTVLQPLDMRRRGSNRDRIAGAIAAIDSAGRVPGPRSWRPVEVGTNCRSCPEVL
jgi:hypothetical protein